MPYKAAVLIAMMGWPLVALALFFALPPRRAVLATVILGTMFLPIAALKLGAGIPLISKLTVTSGSALLGVAFCDTHRLLAFRPRWVDLAMLVWCICPLAASVSNDLGLYDGTSSVFYKVCYWGFPYFLGRLYCSTMVGLTELAKAIFFGGLLYIPFCLIEIRMSPQLHMWTYGFYQHDFGQTIRYGGFRPMVFMNHGIMLTLWMAMATLAGLCLWWWGILRQVLGVKMPWLVAGLALTTVACKSMGAIALMMVGAGALAMIRWAPSRSVILLLAAVPPLMLALRIPKIFSSSDLGGTPEVMGQQRSESLRFRLLNEDFLVDKALRRPFFGWGLWGRARIHDVNGNDITTTDSLWIIELGNAGFAGLLAMLAVFLIPVYGLLRLLPDAETWRNRVVIPSVFACLMVLLFLIDCMFNDFNNPAYLMAVGGLSTLRFGKIRRRPSKPVPVEGVSWPSRA
jgi:hypothetical protein